MPRDVLYEPPNKDTSNSTLFYGELPMYNVEPDLVNLRNNGIILRDVEHARIVFENIRRK